MALFGWFNNPWELMLVALLALLFFGNRLPSVMRSLGKGVTEFKKGVEGIEDDDEYERKRRNDRIAREEPQATTVAKEEPQAVKDPVPGAK